MKNDTRRQDILRKMVGAILASGLTTREIEKIAAEFVSTPVIALEVGQSLIKALQIFDMDPNEKKSSISSSDGYWVELVLDEMRRRGISKKELASLILREGMLDISMSTLQRLPIQEILLRISGKSNKNRISVLLQKLGSNAESDPYLTGIEDR